MSRGDFRADVVAAVKEHDDVHERELVDVLTTVANEVQDDYLAQRVKA